MRFYQQEIQMSTMFSPKKIKDFTIPIITMTIYHVLKIKDFTTYTTILWVIF